MNDATPAIATAPAVKVRDKGLHKNALSFLSNLVIGVASTAPAYSIASALGPIAGSGSYATPAILIAAFIPMLLIAVAYFYLNRADPDCGTVFSWATRALGPAAGWMGGWMLLATNVVVMPGMAVIAGEYTFLLFGVGHPSSLQTTVAGAAWIAVLTMICYAGIEFSARTQQVLLATELAILVLFAAVAFAKASTPLSLDWFDILTVSSYDDFLKAFLIAVFIYWGWDTSVAVNEETENPRATPGAAAVASTVLLVGVYVLVAVAALAFAGPATLAGAADAGTEGQDVFSAIGGSVLGPGLDKLLVLAVLTSAAAAAQTTLLPAARTVLSMASAGAFPRSLARINPDTGSPGLATLLIGLVSIVWFVVLRFFSKSVLDDSIEALGLCVAFYYALTGLSCVIIYQHSLLLSARNFVLMGLLPGAGALSMVFLFVESAKSLAAKAEGAAFGMGVPLAIALGSLVLGGAFMAAARKALPDFFRRKALAA